MARKPKECPTCGVSFIAKVNAQRYCCNEHSKERKRDTTANQYARISGRWPLYVSRLLQNNHNRTALSREFLLGLLEKQNYLCAISGEPLTCILEVGKSYSTNASVDQIQPSQGYTEDNVQFVCARVNTMKWNMPIDELIDWCEKIARYHGKEKA